MLALERSWGNVGTSNADTEADLVGRSVVHPLLVEDMLTGDVGSDVTTDGVTHVGSTVRVELSSLVISHEADRGEVTDGHQLDIEGSLDKVSTGDGTVRDDTGVVTRLCAVGNSDLLNISEGLAGTGGTESAPVIDRVDGSKTRDRGLVDRGVELRGVRVGRSIPVPRLDTDGVGVGSAVLEGRNAGRLGLDANRGEDTGTNKGGDGLGEEHDVEAQTRRGEEGMEKVMMVGRERSEHEGQSKAFEQGNERRSRQGEVRNRGLWGQGSARKDKEGIKRGTRPTAGNRQGGTESADEIAYQSVGESGRGPDCWSCGLRAAST